MNKLPKVILIEIASYLNNLWNLVDFIIIMRIIDPLKIKKQFIGHLCRVVCDENTFLSGRTHDLINAENSGIDRYGTIESLCVYTKIFDAIPVYENWLTKRYNHPIYTRDFLLNEDVLVNKIKSVTDICRVKDEYGVIYLYYTGVRRRDVKRTAFYLKDGKITNHEGIIFDEKCFRMTLKSGIVVEFSIKFLNSSNIVQILDEFYKDTLTMFTENGNLEISLKNKD